MTKQFSQKLILFTFLLILFSGLFPRNAWGEYGKCTVENLQASMYNPTTDWISFTPDTKIFQPMQVYRMCEVLRRQGYFTLTSEEVNKALGEQLPSDLKDVCEIATFSTDVRDKARQILAEALAESISKACSNNSNDTTTTYNSELENANNINTVRDVCTLCQIPTHIRETYFPAFSPAKNSKNSCTGGVFRSLWVLFSKGLWVLVAKLFELLAMLVKFVLGIIISVIIFLLTPSNFGGFVDFPPVRTLWTLTRNLANLGLMLGLVWIAIATILGIKKYSWEKNLWKIIIVALLINFSLVICGIFVDISNFLTTYFLTGASSQVISLKDIVMGTIHTVTCAGVNQTGGMYAMTAFVGFFLSVIFLGQFLGILMYVVIRIVTLWITLIFSPLAAVAWAIPGLEKGWETWRNYFTQALISLPAIAFSLWFILTMINEVALHFPQTTGQAAWQGFVGILSYSVIILILGYGILAVATALGVKQIQQGFSWASKVFWGGLGFLGGVAYRGIGRGTVKSRAWQAVAERLENSNWRPVHNLGIKMQKIRNKVTKPRLEEEKAVMSTMSNDQIRHHIRVYRKHPDIVAQGLNILAERGALSQADVSLLKAAKGSSVLNLSKIKKVNPLLYNRFFTSKEKLDKTKQEIKNQHPDYKKEQQELATQSALLLDSIKNSKAKSLEEGNWADILNHLQQDKEIYQYFLYQFSISNEITPDSAAAIVKSLKDKDKIQFMNNILDALVAKGKFTDKNEAKQYLIKKYGSNSFLKRLLESIDTGPAHPPIIP